MKPLGKNLKYIAFRFLIDFDFLKFFQIFKIILPINWNMNPYFMNVLILMIIVAGIFSLITLQMEFRNKLARVVLAENF